MRLLSARVRGSRLEIGARTGERGDLDARAALTHVRRMRIRPGGSGARLRPRALGHVLRHVAAGRATLRIALSVAARDALARARRGHGVATVEVAVRLRTAGHRITSQQRRVRLR